jgi:Flp pilus assembly protein TadB
MTVFLMLLSGATVGLGVFLLLIPRGVQSTWLNLVGLRSFQFRLAQLAIPFAFVVMLVVTGWAVVAGSVALLVAAIPGIGRPYIQGRNEQELVDGIATWTEQLRDTLAGAHGLEQAIVATSVHAPLVLQTQVKKLASYIGYGSLEDGLRRFGDELNNSTADFVVAALVTASQHQARDLGMLLTQIAQCARDESKMRSRVWVGRARTRSAVKIIATVIVLFVLGLFLFNRPYLQPYSSIQGQVVLSGILGVFAVSLSLMQSMAKIIEPERFVRRRMVLST